MGRQEKKKILSGKWDLQKASHMIKQTLISSLFTWEEFVKYSGIKDAFFQRKSGNIALDRTFEATDSINDTLTEEGCIRCAPSHLGQCCYRKGLESCLDPEDRNHHARRTQISSVGNETQLHLRYEWAGQRDGSRDNEYQIRLLLTCNCQRRKRSWLMRRQSYIER